jgi:hypothetical protein
VESIDRLLLKSEARSLFVVSGLFILHTVVGIGALNKLGTCSQWRSEHFWIIIFLSSIGRGAMKAPHCWKLCKGYLTSVAYGVKVFVVL